MLVQEINPFIRYVSKSVFAPLDDYVYTYDCRLFYVLDGKCIIHIEDTKHSIDNGTVLLFHSGTKYRFVVNSKIKMIVLNFDFTHQNSFITESISPIFEKEYNKNKILEKIEFSKCDALTRPIVLRNAHFIEGDLLKIADEYDKQKIFYKEKASGLFKKVIIEIVRAVSVTSASASDKMDIIIEYLRTNYKDKIDNEKLGNLIGYHSYYLNRLMLASTGTTFHQYLLNYRIECAKSYLVHTELSISDIAAECGFTTVSYFSNCFKTKIGISPLRYRNMRKNLI